MSCNKKLQSTPEVSPPLNVTAQPTPVEPTPELPYTSLSPQEPQYDPATPAPAATIPPEPPITKPEPPPTKKTETPAPEKKTPPKAAEPAQPVVKKTEPPRKVTTPPPPPPIEKKTPVVTPKTPVKKAEPAPIVVKKDEPKPVETKPEPVSASNFIIATYNTMVNEGKKIGAACNLYIERVLEVLGYKTVDFLANDFDVAAKKIFKSYKVVMFTNQTELKRHLWSYRERTGFILQWERVGAPGHIAIVERVGETLYIYQASLNKYTARVEKTTLERLLLVNNNKGVRVYSEFQK